MPDGLAVHLYTDCSLETTVAGAKLKLAMQADYPWDGKVSIQVNPAAATTFTLRLRLPGWCTAPTASINGESVEIAFNARYLADVLTNVDADQFALELNGPLSPGVFKPIGDDRYVHVVMPVRTTS